MVSAVFPIPDEGNVMLFIQVIVQGAKYCCRAWV